MIDPSKVPFYSNTEDDTHCFQAGFKMVLGYFMPERKFSWHQLEQMSAKGEGLATWPQKMLISLDELGFEVVVVEGFDGKAFIKEGEQYLRRTFGKKVALWQVKNSNLAQEQMLYEKVYKQGINLQKRIPTLHDLQGYLSQDYLITATVNSHALRGEPGYVGHFVVILSIDDANVVVHDPGLPARANVKVPVEVFEAAWADPNDNAKNFIAVKLKEKI